MDRALQGISKQNGSNGNEALSENQKITFEIQSHFDVGFLISYFIVLILVQNIYFAYNVTNDPFIKLNKEIEFNLKNKDFIEELLASDLKDKVSLLKTKTNENGKPFEEWIKYLNKDPYVYHPTFKENKFWIQCYKLIPEGTENFHLRVYPDETFLNHTFRDLIAYQNSRFLSKHIEPDPNLIKKFYLLNDKPFSIYQFYTYEPIHDSFVERREIIYRFDDGEGNTGTISSGYIVANINNDYTYDHLKGEGRQLYFLTILITLFLSFFIFAINSRDKRSSLIKSCVFFTIMMTYITVYFSSHDEYGTFEIEKEKLNNINQGILSMSFMSGISIFILNNIKSDRRKHLYYETSFFLIVVMMTTIASLFKNNQYIKAEEITKIRSTKEFIFNYSLLVNFFIIVNFGINVMT